jgi:hypothetical protein
MAQGLSLQMGMKATQPPEARPATQAKVRKVRDPDPERASDDDITDLSSPFD